MGEKRSFVITTVIRVSSLPYAVFGLASPENNSCLFSADDDDGRCDEHSKDRQAA